ncbi:hypothetical protein [Protofrankia symbiont of Coriaria ruscifolia]|uniref:hypothetical protein n=1 Tax=Protofrankia symbiont of Coriaria ruscifolia TaxID=1306542 RepID=UPI001A953ABA|nr:hypothetical protein [Protofrankia symbiont of Coriaria ruscifolia]
MLVSWDSWQALAGAPVGVLATWSQEEAIAYEVAEDLLGSMLAWANAQRWRELEKPTPDPAVVARWREQAADYARQRRELPGDDPAAVARAIREYGPAVRRFYDEPDAGQS